MSTRLALLVAACLTLPCVAHTQETATEEVTVEIEATLYTAGPYGERWSLSASPGRRAQFAYDSLLQPMGSVAGEFFVEPARVRSIATTAALQRFRDLPPSIQPNRAVRLHAPDYRLRLKIGSVTYSVELYEPEGVTDQAQAERFWAVWDQLWSLVPLRPNRRGLTPRSTGPCPALSCGSAGSAG